MSANDPAGSRLTLRSVAVAVSVAVGLTVVFWQPLYRGGGFVGGDVYSYYLPQKDLFAERVRAGEVPLWHSRTGFGYPLVGESQTGVFYPPNWLLYVPLELNRAFNASHLLHYVLAFVFVWLYARRLKLRQAAALLAALVYVYGWFPPRCSLEWAIVGGTWLPAALWQAESFVAAGRRSSLAGLAVVLGLQLLAGHFSLAFITLLTVWLYVPLRLWLAPRDLAERDPSPGRTVRATGLVTLAMAAAFLLAAAQLAPTWQLKTASQRDEVSEEHDPAYGHMPPLYVTQLVASWWYWYAEDIDTDQALRDMKFLASSARTNRVEAHLYFGLLPLILVLLSLLRGRPFRRGPEAVWAILGGLALVYTTGWLIPLTRHLPGFSFFEGPARYGVVTTLAAGLLSGFVLDSLLRRRRAIGYVVFLVVFAATVLEFRVVANRIAVATMVDRPPLSVREDSWVRQQFAAAPQNVRLFAPGPNLPNLCGVAAMPVYLGLAPAEYFTSDLMLPAEQPFPTPAQLHWLEQAAITHVLWLEPLSSDRLTLIRQQADVFLNAAWGRPPGSPVYLYAVNSAAGRAWSEAGEVTIENLTAGEVALQATLEEPGEVVLGDLMSPGWTVEVDGVPAEALRPQAKPDSVRQIFRSVRVPAGRHRIVWKYRPWAVYFGAVVSVLAWLFAMGWLVAERRGGLSRVPGGS